MANLFSGSEIVEIGIQIEKNGKDFYTALADKTKIQKSKDAFKFLAGEEEKHIAVFQKMLDNTDKDKPTDSYLGEYLSYMNELASKCVFTQKDKGSQIAQETKDDKEAIDLGIGFEKDSITFYEGMKKMALEYDQKIIDELVAQEKNHLKQLFDLTQNLQ